MASLCPLSPWAPESLGAGSSSGSGPPRPERRPHQPRGFAKHPPRLWPREAPLRTVVCCCSPSNFGGPLPSWGTRNGGFWEIWSHPSVRKESAQQLAAATTTPQTSFTHGFRE